MDITVCGKTYANVMGVKATDENGDTVVFSAVDGAGNYACTSIEIDNQTAVDFTLDIPGCGVYQGKKITFANPRTAEAGTIISTTAIYPVGGVAMVGLTYNSNLYEVVYSGGFSYDSDLNSIVCNGNGTLTIRDKS